MIFITILIFGALAGSFAFLLELFAMSLFSLPFATEGIFSLSIFFVFLLLALIEEVSKFTFLIRYKKYALHKNKESLSYFIALALLFGIGFSSLEVILSFQNVGTVSFFPIFQTLLLHISTSLLFVFFLFYKQTHKKSLSWRNVWIISGAILIHLSYNIILFFRA